MIRFRRMFNSEIHANIHVITILKMTSVAVCFTILMGVVASHLANSAATAQNQAQPAQSVSKLLNSFGVAAHIGALSPTTVLNELSYLRIWNVRDGTPSTTAFPTFEAVAKGGARFVLLESNVYYPGSQLDAAADVARADQLIRAAPGAVIGIEGSNEYTQNTYYFNGVSSYRNLGWGLWDDAALKAAVRADPLMARVKVIAASEGTSRSIPSLGTNVDAGNVHVYRGVGQQLQTGINAWVAAARASAPGDPVYITETGISSSGFDTSTWGGGVANAHLEAIIDINALLDGFKAGAAITFLYELMDEPGASSVQEQHFGLFNADGTPKPAAVAIGNFTHILRDDGKGGVAAGRLQYRLAGLPSTASSMLLEKSDGTFQVVIWNGEAKLYDGAQEVTPAASTVTLTLGSAARSISIYDPVHGTAAQSATAGASGVSVALSEDPIIIEVKPPAVTGSIRQTQPFPRPGL